MAFGEDGPAAPIYKQSMQKHSITAYLHFTMCPTYLYLVSISLPLHESWFSSCDLHAKLPAASAAMRLALDPGASLPTSLPTKARTLSTAQLGPVPAELSIVTRVRDVVLFWQ